MAGPQTAKEALIAELLGEALGITEKQEKLIILLAEFRKQTLEHFKTLEDQASDRLAITGEKSRKDLARDVTQAQAHLKELVDVIVGCSQTVSASAKTFRASTVGIAIFAGMIGGAAAVAAALAIINS